MRISASIDSSTNAQIYGFLYFDVDDSVDDDEEEEEWSKKEKIMNILDNTIPYATTHFTASPAQRQSVAPINHSLPFSSETVQ